MTLFGRMLSIRKLGQAICFMACVHSGCASRPISSAETSRSLDPLARECLLSFERDDQQISQAGVGDAQYRRIRGYPFLRTDRFTASLADRLNTPSSIEAWIARLSELDARGRAIERLNLPVGSRPSEIELNKLAECRHILIKQLPANPNLVEEVRTRAIVPDSYHVWSRRLGVYPVTSWFVLRGVTRLQAKHSVHFYQDHFADQDHSRRLFGVAQSDITDFANNAAPTYPRDALGVPMPSEQQLAALFHRHQPLWSIDVRTADDRIGTVQFDGKLVDVSTEKPTVYTALTYTRFNDDIMIQLNYTVWFRSRPKTSLFDILGGHLDGITWRVTLNSHGEVLFTDAMHNCGCYYMAFPTPALRAKKRAVRREEPLWIPKSISPDPASRAVVNVSSGAHYIENVTYSRDGQIDHAIATADYDQLRTLNFKGNESKSMFSSDGLVEHTERGERWLLWPMGIRSAGAMRQFGHHPIAFVGRRHFDDPYLLESYFDLAPTNNGR